MTNARVIHRQTNRFVATGKNHHALAAVRAAAAAAEAGAQATREMTARRGRSSYLGDRVKGHPDPGAVAAAIWLRAIVV